MKRFLSIFFVLPIAIPLFWIGLAARAAFMGILAGWASLDNLTSDEFWKPKASK